MTDYDDWERECSRRYGIACLQMIGGPSEEIRSCIALLRAGRAPEALTDELFARLLAKSTARGFANAQFFNDSRPSEGLSRSELGRLFGLTIADATGLHCLIRLGTTPSASQLERMLQECVTSSEKRTWAEGLRARTEFLMSFNILAHLFTKTQWERLFAICDPHERAGLMARWADSGAYQADIAALFEKELTSVVQAKNASPQTRIEANSLRERIRGMGPGTAGRGQPGHDVPGAAKVPDKGQRF